MRLSCIRLFVRLSVSPIRLPYATAAGLLQCGPRYRSTAARSASGGQQQARHCSVVRQADVGSGVLSADIGS